jgi:hypothetical protein
MATTDDRSNYNGRVALVNRDSIGDIFDQVLPPPELIGGLCVIRIRLEVGMHTNTRWTSICWSRNLSAQRRATKLSGTIIMRLNCIN